MAVRSQKPLAPRSITFLLLSILCYFILPVYLARFLSASYFKALTAFYFIICSTGYFLYRRYLRSLDELKYKIGQIEESINLLNEEISREIDTEKSLRSKIKRYDGLKSVIEDLNSSLNINAVSETLVSIAFSNISGGKGICILYLINPQLNLEIFKAKKEQPGLVIKEKQGDIFDFWVLRHSSPLLIEDTSRDFRFDLSKLKSRELRPIKSLISSPIETEYRFLGTIRLEHNKENFFSQEDLRFLLTIADLGAVALENSQFFKNAEDLAVHDSLTGLYTKGYFLERLKEECSRSLRKGTGFAFFMLDIDFFKTYNDKFGHAAGDIVLRKLSHVLSDFFKGLNPIIGRFGGEEFSVIIPQIEKAKALELAGGLCRRIEEEKIILRRLETNITVSMGIAVFPLDAKEEEEIMRIADKALYMAKEKGKNRVCSF